MPLNPPAPPPKISCRNVWKVFGPPERTRFAHRLGQRLPTLSRHLSRLPRLPRLPRYLTRRQTGNALREIVAVRDVSFDVWPGEIFVVMGLSGSGKSTLLRTICRLIEPTHGQIVIDGRDMTQLNRRELRHVRRHTMSMVFQKFALFSHRRVIENVAYGLEVRGMEKEARLRHARTMLELVGLDGWQNHYPHELSGGMQQRVGLARALAVDPEILLCDEPFSALDPLIRREMQQELLRLQQVLHKTILFVTHDFAEAVRLGDRIAIMKDGAVVQIGTPEEIVSRPINDYVRDFSRDVSRSAVLTARAIMRPVDGGETAGLRTVSADARLDSLIPITAAHDADLAVLAGERVVGLINRTDVLLALSPAAN
jgi:glycine betaine/proline transport system ATP-binding protein